MWKKSRLVAVAFFIAGCTTDISHRVPFSSFVGRPLVTKRATFLYRDSPSVSPAEWCKIPNLEDEDRVRSPRDYRRLQQEASVPAGQRVTVRQVLNYVADGAVFYYAMGDVFVPSLRRSVEFRYEWGLNDEIHRAPWEDADVPLVRRAPW